LPNVLNKLFVLKEKSTLNTDQQLEEIILRCSKNDNEAQMWVFKTYYSMLMTICLRYTDDEDDAKDILNEGYLKIFQNLITKALSRGG